MTLPKRCSTVSLIFTCLSFIHCHSFKCLEVLKGCPQVQERNEIPAYIGLSCYGGSACWSAAVVESCKNASPSIAAMCFVTKCTYAHVKTDLETYGDRKYSVKSGVFRVLIFTRPVPRIILTCVNGQKCWPVPLFDGAGHKFF